MHLAHKNRLKRARRQYFLKKKLMLKDKNLICLRVIRSNKHIGAQLIRWDPMLGSSQVLLCASTMEASVRENCSEKTWNKHAASCVGRKLAERFMASSFAETATIMFDRAGYAFHGRVQSLAEAAREGGMKF
jgi:large subunit ribosomal protein L18